ncbi:hypothetical protein HAX54_007070 [Datura stramonium]|uniref:Uncharacterized protein n=1 Tax=Datura stramonium TaxID=4076 RepID=A0ABS8WWK5_DATST|nr:hypothetical protein [Datura stramonium]
MEKVRMNRGLHIAESSPPSHSSDTRLVKPIDIPDYNLRHRDMVAIKKNCRVVENDLEPSRELVEFGIIGGDATIINHDDIEIDEFSPNFDVGGRGVGGGGGGEGFSPINEEARCPPKLHSQGRIFYQRTLWKILISKRGVKPSSKNSDSYTPNVVKRRKRQISKALTRAKKKAKNTPRNVKKQSRAKLVQLSQHDKESPQLCSNKAYTCWAKNRRNNYTANNNRQLVAAKTTTELFGNSLLCWVQ